MLAWQVAFVVALVALVITMIILAATGVFDSNDDNETNSAAVRVPRETNTKTMDSNEKYGYVEKSSESQSTKRDTSGYVHCLDDDVEIDPIIPGSLVESSDCRYQPQNWRA